MRGGKEGAVKVHLVVERSAPLGYGALQTEIRGAFVCPAMASLLRRKLQKGLGENDEVVLAVEEMEVK